MATKPISHHIKLTAPVAATWIALCIFTPALCSVCLQGGSSLRSSDFLGLNRRCTIMHDGRWRNLRCHHVWTFERTPYSSWLRISNHVGCRRRFVWWRPTASDLRFREPFLPRQLVLPTHLVAGLEPLWAVLSQLPFRRSRAFLQQSMPRKGPLLGLLRSPGCSTVSTIRVSLAL